ncbi:uncharacterized protein SEPMUDRAFT_124215 [Sphaerulina musiva SO2202]|uniref:Uncharacterized protein n=1 Tax=Sphaerulina musiva (strain SO2202) TaxID=692275 RepID=M3DEA7_SPHMS|nr:uncharacterized protein SEPMUDRAFT_124215 [Sphaerulina musiva SO2202]EMF16120.1 hypothetical protein SEPMUDRAFT_124215 [Sphaerulina musiva SO2202]
MSVLLETRRRRLLLTLRLVMIYYEEALSTVLLKVISRAIMEEINGSWSRISAALQAVSLLESECASVV